MLQRTVRLMCCSRTPYRGPDDVSARLAFSTRQQMLMLAF